jgi:hypothetical protein
MSRAGARASDRQNELQYGSGTTPAGAGNQKGLLLLLNEMRIFASLAVGAATAELLKAKIVVGPKCGAGVRSPLSSCRGRKSLPFGCPFAPTDGAGWTLPSVRHDERCISAFRDSAGWQSAGFLLVATMFVFDRSLSCLDDQYLGLATDCLRLACGVQNMNSAALTRGEVELVSGMILSVNLIERVCWSCASSEIRLR